MARPIAEDGPVRHSAENSPRILISPDSSVQTSVCSREWLAAPHVAVWWNERFDRVSIRAGKVRSSHWMGASRFTCTLFSSRAFRSAGFNGTAGATFRSMRFNWVLTSRPCNRPRDRGRSRDYGSRAGACCDSGIREQTTFLPTAAGRAIVADPSVSNLNSIGAFKKAGFNLVNRVQLVGEAFERHVVRLDR